jgi:hypothetical protein
MQSRIKRGWDMPPLILMNNDGELSLRDGNHRMEALLREKIKEYWVIIWDNECFQNLEMVHLPLKLQISSET